LEEYKLKKKEEEEEEEEEEEVALQETVEPLQI
jgi:hypothetical protein